MLRGVTAAYRALTPTVLVRIQARQPSSICDFGFAICEPPTDSASPCVSRHSQIVNPARLAVSQMVTNVATGLDIEGENHIRPVPWEGWITLPIREGDNAGHTARRAIRVPTVIVAVNFAKVPKKRPKLSARNIRERDGNRCQYTGRLLHPDEGSLDHVVTRPSQSPRFARLPHRPSSFPRWHCSHRPAAS